MSHIIGKKLIRYNYLRLIRYGYFFANGLVGFPLFRVASGANNISIVIINKASMFIEYVFEFKLLCADGN